MKAGVFSSLVRFLCHGPLGYYCVNALKHWRFVKQHAGILLDPPLSHKIQIGEQLAGPWGAFALAWNIVMWLHTFYASEPVLLLLGIVDALIVAALIVATSIEGTYVGKTTHECAQVSANGSPDHSLIFFDRATAINMTNTDYGKNLCNDFLATFYVGIAMIIMYGLSAFANIYTGALWWRDAAVPYNQRYNRRYFTWDPGCFRLVTLPFVLLWDIILGVSFCMLSFLPKWINHPIRFSSRVAGKWGGDTTASAKIRLRQIPRRLRRAPYKKMAADRALEAILLHNVLLLIAPKLHYVDFVNLSMVSKRIRAVMFPIPEAHDKERELRLYSCYGNIKTECWICSIQICHDCSGTKKTHDTTVSAHMKLCQARCSKCFYFEINTLKRRCRCYDAHTANGRPCNINGTAMDRMLCRDCLKMGDTDHLHLRAKRDRVTYTNLTRQSLACARCSDALPLTGPLWWMCSKCSAECRSHDHPGWRRKLEI